MGGGFTLQPFLDSPSLQCRVCGKGRGGGVVHMKLIIYIYTFFWN